MIASLNCRFQTTLRVLLSTKPSFCDRDQFELLAVCMCVSVCLCVCVSVSVPCCPEPCKPSWKTCTFAIQVEQAAADVKVREAAAAKREADLSRQEAASLSGNADAMKRDAELAGREQALAAQLTDLKAAEAQLQEKKLEAKELQVGRPADCCNGMMQQDCL